MIAAEVAIVLGGLVLIAFQLWLSFGPTEGKAAAVRVGVLNALRLNALRMPGPGTG